jgi:XRE family transcriptional regulator, aerobic/anaerobic benzoate catabolism transcriptional regulator
MTSTHPPSTRALAEPLALSVGDSEFLAALGKRVRTMRERRAISRKQLAHDANVSERYLGQLETGEGNVSVLLLRRIAAAMNVTEWELLIPEHQDTVETRLIRRFLERLPAHRMEDVILRLMRDFGHEDTMRRKRVALIGLRGAGKSTLGAMLASEFGWRCVELSREIERETALPINEVIALYGQGGYRRLERKALERALGDPPPVVLVVGGGLVTEEETFNLLLAKCYTVWLKAQPEEHMARVLAQGDFRPMAGNEEAMQDLKRILDSRVPLYRKADAIVDTSGDTPAGSLARLRATLAD